MTKPRPISSVHVDIARFAWEVSNLSKDSPEDLGVWTLRLVECLVKRDPAIHAYGAHLLAEVDEFRKADSDRKKAKYSVDSVDSVDSPESPPRSDQIRSDQSRSNQENTALPRAPAAHRVKAKAQKTGPQYAPEVFRVYEYWHKLLKASARKSDALKWIARQGAEHGFDRLIMAVNRYSLECKRQGTEKKFLKECANFFGEDAAFEGFLPSEEFYAEYRERALQELNGGQREEAA